MANKVKKDVKIVKVEITPESKLKKALEGLKKECIRIMPTKPGFDKSQAVETRFGGPGYLEAEDKVPVCTCGKPLSFVFQFRESYDKDMKPSGALYSVYYCFDYACGPIGRPEEEKGQWAVITHKNPDNSKFVEHKENVKGDLNPVTCSLSRVFVLPDYETIENNYPEISELCEEIDCEDPMSAYEDAGNEIGCVMEPISTIGGYPVWLQGEGSQVCPKCQGEVELAVQLDSEEAVNLMWGDAGCLYVFRCPKHKDGYAIEMQCF